MEEERLTPERSTALVQHDIFGGEPRHLVTLRYRLWTLERYGMQHSLTARREWLEEVLSSIPRDRWPKESRSLHFPDVVQIIIEGLITGGTWAVVARLTKQVKDRLGSTTTRDDGILEEEVAFLAGSQRLCIAYPWIHRSTLSNLGFSQMENALIVHIADGSTNEVYDVEVRTQRHLVEARVMKRVREVATQFCGAGS